MKDTKNSTMLQSFTEYCEYHPEERFWQALRNWSRYSFIYGQRAHGPIEDTFHLEGLDREKTGKRHEKENNTH